MPDLEKTAKESSDNWTETSEWRYYLAIKKAIEDWDMGKNYTETMRLIISSLEHDENIDYTNLPTAGEATRIFMEMWSRQFPEIKEMKERDLQEFIRNNFSKVSSFPEDIMIKSLNPNNMNEKAMLQNLKNGMWWYIIQCKDRILDNRKEWDIKVLYAMKLLEENLEKKVTKTENQHKIEELKDILFKSNKEWIPKEEEKEKLNEKTYNYFNDAEKKWTLKQTLADFLNHIYPEIPAKIEKSDITSLEIIKQPKELLLLNRDTDTNFNRFYLKLNFGDYKTLARKLQHWYSWWMNVPFMVDDIETSLIIAPNNPEFLIHELAHSIDPYLGKREAENAIIDEYIWYYTSRIYPAIIESADNKTWKKIERIKETTFTYFKSYFYSEIYWENLNIDKIMTFNEYKKFVDNTVDLLEKVEKEIGGKWLFKLLLSSKTFLDIKSKL